MIRIWISLRASGLVDERLVWKTLPRKKAKICPTFPFNLTGSGKNSPNRVRDGIKQSIRFFDSIANNIAIAKPGASREEIIEAAKKASIHDFITTLSKGYDTEVGELGDTLSGGEKQRIGIARAFLHECPLILLDEPTSNLDSLNEEIILKSLKESAKKKTVALVSHRVSTMNVADVVYEMENGRIS